MAVKPTSPPVHYRVAVEPCDAGVRIYVFDAATHKGLYADLDEKNAEQHIASIQTVLADRRAALRRRAV